MITTCRGMKTILAVSAIVICCWAVTFEMPLKGQDADATANQPNDDEQEPIEDEQDEDLQLSDERSRIKLSDWDLLSFEPTGPKQLLRVDVSLLPEGEFHPISVAGKKGLQATIEDAPRLGYLAGSLDRPLRIAYPERTDMWEGSGWAYTVGEVKIVRRDKTFNIGISRAGFLLESAAYAPQNAFFSWGLARVIDDELFKQHKIRLPNDVFDSLSGQSHIDSDKYRYGTSRN